MTKCEGKKDDRHHEVLGLQLQKEIMTTVDAPDFSASTSHVTFSSCRHFSILAADITAAHMGSRLA